jgi:hypothetical protein
VARSSKRQRLQLWNFHVASSIRLKNGSNNDGFNSDAPWQCRGATWCKLRVLMNAVVIALAVSKNPKVNVAISDSNNPSSSS